MSRTLHILSINFNDLNSRLMWAACATCSSLGYAFSRVLSSVTSITMAAMTGPNVATSSALLVSVSSTVSCSTAAHNMVGSLMPPSSASTLASAIGWLI